MYEYGEGVEQSLEESLKCYKSNVELHLKTNRRLNCMKKGSTLKKIPKRLMNCLMPLSQTLNLMTTMKYLIEGRIKINNRLNL